MVLNLPYFILKRLRRQELPKAGVARTSGGKHLAIRENAEARGKESAEAPRSSRFPPFPHRGVN